MRAPTEEGHRGWSLPSGGERHGFLIVSCKVRLSIGFVSLFFYFLLFLNLSEPDLRLSGPEYERRCYLNLVCGCSSDRKLHSTPTGFFLPTQLCLPPLSQPCLQPSTSPDEACLSPHIMFSRHPVFPSERTLHT